MRKVRLDALAVVHASVAHRRARSPNGDVRGTIPAASVPVLRNLVHNLVKGREDVVGELHLRDRAVACDREANSETSDRLLRDRRVQHAARSEFFAEAHRRPENSTERNVLTEENRPLLRRQSDGQGIVNGRHHGHLFCGAGGRRRNLQGRGRGEPRLQCWHWSVEVSVTRAVVLTAVLTDVALNVSPLLLQVPRELVVHVREKVLQRRAFFLFSSFECL
mmetsp:Transcript_102590/g.289866  ORF Transcript_102590/g.289866 Transcript_102590/m.289866 type:complete len:220 (+) Transcript_102590:783-1442(+)